MDKTPPEIYSNFSIKPIGTKGGLNIYPNYVRMYLGATDAHTGTESVMYSIDDAPMTQYSTLEHLMLVSWADSRKIRSTSFA